MLFKKISQSKGFILDTNTCLHVLTESYRGRDLTKLSWNTRRISPIETNPLMGLFEKWSALDPKAFYAIPFQKLMFLVSVYPEILEKKIKK